MYMHVLRKCNCDYVSLPSPPFLPLLKSSIWKSLILTNKKAPIFEPVCIHIPVRSCDYSRKQAVVAVDVFAFYFHNNKEGNAMRKRTKKYHNPQHITSIQ